MIDALLKAKLSLVEKFLARRQYKEFSIEKKDKDSDTTSSNFFSLTEYDS